MTFRVACLGAGYFAQFHRNGWERIDDVKIVGIADRDGEKASQSGYPFFGDLRKMLEISEPDILDIITPPETHKDAIQIAVEFNLKLIICQKPFCTSLKEAREMAAIAKTSGIQLIIHENFRFQPWFRSIKNVLKSGAIGDPIQATFRLRPGDGQGPNAYLDRQPYFQKMPRFLVHETGVHYIDVFRYLFGNPAALYADLRQINPVINGEDAGMVIFDHDNGVRTLLDGNRNLDHAAVNIRCTMGEALIEGTDGTLTLLGDGSVHLRKFSETLTDMILAPDKSRNFGGDCTFRLQRHAIDALLDQCAFENEVSDYLTVIEIENAIYDSAETMQKIELKDYVK